MANSKKSKKKKYTAADFVLYGIDCVIVLLIMFSYMVDKNTAGAILSGCVLLGLVGLSRLAHGFRFSITNLSYHLLYIIFAGYICLIPVLVDTTRGKLIVISFTSIVFLGLLLTFWDRFVEWWYTR